MRWTQVVGLALVISAVGGASLAAQTAVADTAAPSPESSWPVVVPRLVTYTDAQKASITAAVQQYCFQNARPSRAELQARIRAILTPEQVPDAVQYWIPQDVEGDLRAIERGLMADAALTQPPRRAAVLTMSPAAPTLDACGRPRKASA